MGGFATVVRGSASYEKGSGVVAVASSALSRAHPGKGGAGSSCSPPPIC